MNPIPSNLFAKESTKRGSYVYKTAYKATIIVVETKEHLQLLDIGGISLPLNYLSFFKIGIDSAT